MPYDISSSQPPLAVHHRTSYIVACVRGRYSNRKLSEDLRSPQESAAIDGMGRYRNGNTFGPHSVLEYTDGRHQPRELAVWTG